VSHENNFQLLKGQTIVRAMHSKSEDAIGFELASEQIMAWTPEGDCCAYAYFQHVNNPDALRGLVRSVDVGETDYDGGERGEGDHTDTWITTISTGHGSCQIEMRCEHNGYYGGWAQLVTHMHHVDDWQPLVEF